MSPTTTQELQELIDLGLTKETIGRAVGLPADWIDLLRQEDSRFSASQADTVAIHDLCMVAKTLTKSEAGGFDEAPFSISAVENWLDEPCEESDCTRIELVQQNPMELLAEACGARLYNPQASAAT